MTKHRIRQKAIFGGTFDPIHRGHIRLACAASEECGLDELIFVPNYISPFKQDRKTANGLDRAAMVEGILRYHPSFRMSDYELKRSGPSYTYETLAYFRQRYPKDQLSFLIGFDSVLHIDTWYHGEDLIREYPLITGFRPEISNAEGLRKIEEYRKKYQADIRVIRLEPADVSSTEIRERIERGEAVQDLIMPETEEYIRNHGLYQHSAG